MPALQSVHCIHHRCDDPPHGTQYHSFFDDIEDSKSQLSEFVDYDRETCKDVFGEDSLEYLWIFCHEQRDKRVQCLEEYVLSRKNAMDRFPEKHEDDPDHEEVLLAMKKQQIQCVHMYIHWIL